MLRRAAARTVVCALAAAASASPTQTELTRIMAA